MHSLRRWFYRPKKEDSSKLALFYWADEELTMVASELDSFDGRTDPDRCSILVSQLRICQDKVLSICNDIMDDAIPDRRANRDFRAKFPDDVLHENLSGQLWFGAECLAAGSNIIHRELESANLRPLAKVLTRALDNVRCLLREQSLKNSLHYSEKVQEALRIFDVLFAEFELCYVSLMVSIKSAKEYHLQQEIIVLFSETLIRALKIGLVTQEMVDDYDPSLMFTIPRLAIVWGLLLYPNGPFNVEKDSADLSELFRPFCNLLFKIRDLLWTLTEAELHTLEKMLCSLEEPKIDEKSALDKSFNLKAPDTVSLFYKNQINCKQFIHDFYAYNFGTNNPENTVDDCLDEKPFLYEKHSISWKYFSKFRSSDKIEGDFDRTCIGSHSRRISPDIPESDIETVVSEDLDYEDTLGSDRNCDKRKFCAEQDIHFPQNKEKLSDLNLDNTEKEEGLPKIITDDCSCCSNDNLTSLERTTSSLEKRLSRLHDDCMCGVNSTSREHLTPSRDIMQQVMRRVEIVPPGQRITGYSSSVENSPRAYHHGLLSHSFPTQSQNNTRLEFPTKVRSHRHTRRKSQRQSVVNSHTEHSSPIRCYKSIDPEDSQSVAASSSPLLIPRVQQLREEEATSFSSCSSCQSISSISSAEWDSTSPDTSSYNSECQDDKEIALALQAAEIASRNKARSRFKSSRDLLHKLFVCVSGVADQLQTNYASDLRNILKSVFDMNCTKTEEICDNIPTKPDSSVDNRTEMSAFFTSDNGNDVLSSSTVDEGDGSSVDSAEEVIPDNSPPSSLVMPNELNENGNRTVFDGPPAWMPDELCPNCVSCRMQFTILRRRHHCRNCGKIFCSRCSSNSIPLPRFGHLKPVRVCNQCFMYELANLVMQRG